jgi:hypothetical protein
MNRSFLLLAAVAALTGCTSLEQSVKLAEGSLVLDIAPVQVDVQVDTTRTLTGVGRTTWVLGVLRFGDRTTADFPGMPFGPGAVTREKRAAIYKALKDTDFDVLVNPKYIVEEQRAILFRRTTCIVAGYGGKFEFQP